MAEKVITKTASEFFADNKQIAGFDNPARSLFTSIRELVENGLDASEAAGVLPEIILKVRALESKEIYKMLGIRSKKDEWILKVKSKVGGTTTGSSGFEQPAFYEITCVDNGTGISHVNIPKVFGIVLTGTKYGIRQHRGRFGLGAKMALIYAQETSGYPLEVFSKTATQRFVSHYLIELDIHQNKPRIKLEEKITPKKFAAKYPEYSIIIPHGTVVKLVMGGDWIRSKRYIVEYFRQIAIITPYASFKVELPGVKLEFPRTVEQMPPPPKPVLPHPSGVGLQQLKSIRDRLVSSGNDMSVSRFLMTNFQRVGTKTAKDFLKSINISPTKKISELSEQDLLRIAYQFKHYKFLQPDASCLSPLGPDLLKQSIIKIMKCEFVEAVQRPPVSYEGHPMIVEVGMGYGGDIPPGITLFRFANRIPLLYGAGNDVSTKVIEEINWSRYKLDKKRDPILIAVSVVSTKIPFPETSKEYISDVDVLHREIKLAITDCARRLSSVIVRKKKVEREKKRVNILLKYAEHALKAVSNVLVNINKRKYSYDVLIEKAKEIVLHERKIEELEKKVEEAKVKENDVKQSGIIVETPPAQKQLKETKIKEKIKSPKKEKSKKETIKKTKKTVSSSKKAKKVKESKKTAKKATKETASKKKTTVKNKTSGKKKSKRKRETKKSKKSKSQLTLDDANK